MSWKKYAITAASLVVSAGVLVGVGWYHSYGSALAKRKHAGNVLLNQVSFPDGWKQTGAVVSHDHGELVWTRVYIAPTSQVKSVTDFGRRLSHTGFDVGPADRCYNASPCAAFFRDHYQVTVGSSEEYSDDTGDVCTDVCTHVKLVMSEPDSP